MRSICRKKNIAAILSYMIIPLFFLINAMDRFIGSSHFLDYDISTRMLVSDLIKNMEFPFINPYIFGAFPLFESPHTSFYPPVLLFDLMLPIQLSYNLLIYAHMAAGGILMYFLLKSFQIKSAASFMGGLLWMLSGVFITLKSNPNVLFSSLWLAAVLLCFQRFKQSKKFSTLLGASIFYALIFLGGSFQVFYSSTLILIAYILFTSLGRPVNKNKWFLSCLLSIGLGLMMVLFRLMPVLFHLRESFAEQGAAVLAQYSAFSFRSVLLFFSPFALGSRSGFLNIIDYFGPGNYWTTVIYFGIVPLAFAVFGMLAKQRHKVLWTAVFSFSFLMAALINGLIKEPVFSYLNTDTTWWFGFGFALSILCGFGIDFILRTDQDIKKPAINIASLFIGIIVLFFAVYALMNTAIRADFMFFMEKIGLQIQRPAHLITSLRLQGWPVIAPMAILLLSAFSLILFYKKKKVMLALLFAILVFDLFSFAVLFEDHSKKSDFAVNASMENFSYLKYDADNPYRIYQSAEKLGNIAIRPNLHSINKMASITGFVPYYMQENIYLGRDADASEPERALIKNNHLLSVLSTRYVILADTDAEQVLEGLAKDYYIEPKMMITQKDTKEASFQDAYLDDENKIVLGDSDTNMKMVQIPLKLEANTDYLVTFAVKADADVNNALHVDFFGVHYDRDEQEFFLTADAFDEGLILVEQIIHTGIIPELTEETFFRMFTYSTGQFEIDKLEVVQLKKETFQYYALKYADDQNMILENKNQMPLFYFASNLIPTESVDEAEKILWEEGVYFKEERFDPKEMTLITGADMFQRPYPPHGSIEIIENTNHRSIIKTDCSSESFLVFSNVFFDNWRATINGKPAKIYLVNAAVMGLFVPQGPQMIEFVYMPAYFRLYGIISLSALILTIAGLVLLKIIESKRFGKSKEKK